MKMKKYIAALLAAVLCLSLCACLDQERPRSDKNALSLWYVEGDAAAERLTALAEEYAAENEPVLVRGFADEDSLAAAFESARPDLLLCSLQRAAELYDRGLLRDISPAMGDVHPAYTEQISRRCEGIGKGIFPIGSEVQLLYSAPGCFEDAPPDTMSGLMELAAEYGRETGLPFFSADSFSDLMYDAMLVRGEELHGLLEKDINNEAYRDVYNLFASAAYDGGLAVTRYSARELVDSGYLPCAAARSSSLVGVSADSSISLLPADGGGSSRLACCLCVAVTAPESRPAGRIARFMSWLTESRRLNALALDSGLVPAGVGAAPTDESGLVSALMGLYSTAELHMPDYSRDYLNNRDGLEAELRRSLEFLG